MFIPDCFYFYSLILKLFLFFVRAVNIDSEVLSASEIDKVCSLDMRINDLVVSTPFPRKQIGNTKFYWGAKGSTV